MHRSRRGGLLACLGAAALSSGCMLAAREDVLIVEDKIDGLNGRLEAMQKSQADLSYKLDQLDGSIAALNENLKDNQDKMSQLASRLDDLQARVGQSVQSLSEAVREERQAAREAAVAAAREAAEGPAREAALKALEEASKREAAAGSPTKVYRDAYLQFVKKDYATASQGFSVYLEKYPKGELADLATFYLAESRYAAKKWEEAAAQYASLLESHPKSDLIPSARLKYAYSLLNLGTDGKEARRYLESIVADFPRSPEARTAKEKLASLNGKKAEPSKPAPKK